MAILSAMVARVLATFFYTVYKGHANGAANYGGIFTGGLACFPWGNFFKKVQDPFATQWELLAAMVIGSTMTGILMILRYRVAWWPFHPIGFTAGPVYPVNSMVFPIFIAWALKSLILGLGGVRAYRDARKFFQGLSRAHFVGAGSSFIVI